MHQYENTKFLRQYLEPRRDEIQRRIEEGGGDGDAVQQTADVLRDLTAKLRAWQQENQDPALKRK